MNTLLVAFMFAAAVCVADEICEKGENVKLTKSLSMVCKKRGWTPKVKKDRANPGAPPCEDSIGEDQCQADRGHCLQYTDKGQEMERTCPGTCDSCDGCRCQDNSQWHMYCPYWAQYCSSAGVLGTWMTDNCKKTCNKCRCPCCTYKGKSHRKGEKIAIPEKCGEMVCEEGLQAPASSLLAGAVQHNISHPEELTLTFRSLFPGSDCCIVNGSASGMVEEGWQGKVTHKDSVLQATCCHGVLCTALKDANRTNPTAATTTTSTTTTTTTTATTTTLTTTTTTPSTTTTSSVNIPAGAKLYLEENGNSYFGVPVAKGKTLVEGTVPDTCEEAGMRAVCSGDSSCEYSSRRCENVAIEAGICGNCMRGLAKKICSGAHPSKCPQLEGLFNYMNGWGRGECGNVGGSMCVAGNDYVSGNTATYYAYCIKN